MNAKEKAIRIILDTSEQTIGEVLDFLEKLQEKERRQHPVLKALAEASIDDEPLTIEEEEAVMAARAEEGFVTSDDLKKELGLR